MGFFKRQPIYATGVALFFLVWAVAAFWAVAS